MNSIAKIAFLVYIVVTLTSCKHTCSGYDVSNKIIISFRQNDTIEYISNLNDTMILIVNNFYSEGTSSVSGFFTDYDCNPESYYMTSTDKKTNLFIKELHNWEIQVHFGKETLYRLPWQMLSAPQTEKSNVLHVAEKEINGVVFQQVWEVEDISGQRPIDRFIKVGYYGIIEFHDKITGLTWTQLRKL